MGEASFTEHSPHALEVDVGSDTSSIPDSAFGNSIKSSTDSINSEVVNFRYENGRRYHGYRDGAYYLPNDEAEGERLDYQHCIWLLTLEGRLHLAPISEEITDVLDVATGTGVWAIDFADQYPSANVIGTDLSPIQPDFVPPNCAFMIDDSESEWCFDRKFDYIHMRMVMIGWRDWPKFFKQSYDNLNPGGWLELQDYEFPAACDDSSAGPESPLIQWTRYIWQAARMGGCDLSAVHLWEQQLRDAGFTEIHRKTYQWPTNPWAKGEKEKLLGKMVHKDVMDGASAMCMGLFTRYLQWSREQVEYYLVDVRKHVSDPRAHCYLPM
ncbi:MAG: hypothetical protein M1834_007513 [Cirrosporium novae-zelandiae]|nr:MAG: hypothetical protein M1834_007513 [Cirrosporium novae-zelandiae]